MEKIIGLTNDIKFISHMYNYLSPPPYGTGSHTRLVTETSNRAIKYAKLNPTKISDKLLSTDGSELYSQIDLSETPTISKEIQGFWNKDQCVTMIKDFCLRYKIHIDLAIQETIQWAHRTSIGTIGQGKQTLNVLDGYTIKASAALERYCNFLKLNGMGTDFTLISFIEAIWKLFEKDEIVIERKKWVRVPKKVNNVYLYGRKGRLYKFEMSKERVTYRGEEKNKVLWDHLRTLETFRKDGERGKSVRRAIASPGIPLRAFFKIIEEFAKKLCNKIPESTISIGGDEKRDKIQNVLNQTLSDSLSYNYKLIITGDNSKWNETQSPQLMMLVMEMFCSNVDDWFLETKKDFAYSKFLMLKIARTCFSVMYQKQLKTGLGFRLISQSRKKYKYIGIEELRQKGLDVEGDNIDDLSHVMNDNCIVVSPGMVMGMLNIFSTLCGVIASTYNSHGEHDNEYMVEVRKNEMLKRNVRIDLLRKTIIKDPSHFFRPNAIVRHLQSSDDFFTIVIAVDEEAAIAKVNELFCNNKLMGINWSVEKTFIREWKNGGVGEYTQWFVYKGALVNQCGADTAQMRPQGNNCYSDMASFTKNVVQNLSVGTSNYFGANVGMKLFPRFLRILYNIKRGDTPMELPMNLVSFSNGGSWKFTPSNSHLDEIAMLFTFYDDFLLDESPNKEKMSKYLRRVINPKCPLNSNVTVVEEFNPDKMEFDTKEIGMIMNCNNLQIRSNKKLSNKKIDEIERKNVYGIAEKVAVFIHPVLGAINTNIKTPLRKMLNDKLDFYLSRSGDFSDSGRKLVEELVSNIKEVINK